MFDKNTNPFADLPTEYIGETYNDNKAETTVPMLTDREKEIMELIAEGLTNKQITERLNIKYCTTVTHIQKIYEKFGVATFDRAERGVIRVRAVLYWLKYKEDILENQK